MYSVLLAFRDNLLADSHLRIDSSSHETMCTKSLALSVEKLTPVSSANEIKFSKQEQQERAFI